jgi:hypothetical protein
VPADAAGRDGLSSCLIIGVDDHTIKDVLRVMEYAAFQCANTVQPTFQVSGTLWQLYGGCSSSVGSMLHLPAGTAPLADAVCNRESTVKRPSVTPSVSVACSVPSASRHSIN